MRRSINELVNTPREYLKRREAEELREVRAETSKLRAALLAESHHRSGGRRRTAGFVRRVRFS